MDKLKLYSVDETYDGETCRGYGYYRELPNAMTMALKVVANLQDDLVSMRELDAEFYKDDIKRIEVVNPNIIAEWVGSFRGVVIYQIETED